MDYKEKYEALVGGIKGWLDKYVVDWQHGVFNLPFDKTGEIAKDIIKLVPELRESEDEMMRKSLIEYLKTKDHECDHWIAYLEKQKEQQKEELAYRLNGLMQDYIKEGKDEEEREHRFKCYKLFWDALEDSTFFEQKEQIRAEIAPNQFDGITYGMQGRSTAMPAERTINKWAGSKRGLPPGTRTMFPINGDDDEKLLGFMRDHFWNLVKLQDENERIYTRCLVYLDKSKEQKPAEWSEEDQEQYHFVLSGLSYAQIDMERVGSLDGARQVAWASVWFKNRIKSLRPQPKQEWSDDDEKNWGQIFACITDDALKEWLEKQKAKIIADIKNDQTTEGQHNDQTIAWKKYEDGHRFDSDTVVIGLNRSEPRLVRCAVSACYGIAVKDLMKLPFCL